MILEEDKELVKKAERFGYSFSEYKGTLFMKESRDIIIQETNEVAFFKKVRENIEELEANIN